MQTPDDPPLPTTSRFPVKVIFDTDYSTDCDDPGAAVEAQLQRFERLMARPPDHIDSHHDVHRRDPALLAVRPFRRERDRRPDPPELGGDPMIRMAPDREGQNDDPRFCSTDLLDDLHPRRVIVRQVGVPQARVEPDRGAQHLRRLRSHLGILVLKHGGVAMFGSRDEVLKVIMGARRHIAVVGGPTSGESSDAAATITKVAE